MQITGFISSKITVTKQMSAIKYMQITGFISSKITVTKQMSAINKK